MPQREEQIEMRATWRRGYNLDLPAKEVIFQSISFSAFFFIPCLASLPTLTFHSFFCVSPFLHLSFPPSYPSLFSFFSLPFLFGVPFLLSLLPAFSFRPAFMSFHFSSLLISFPPFFPSSFLCGVLSLLACPFLSLFLLVYLPPHVPFFFSSCLPSYSLPFFLPLSFFSLFYLASMPALPIFWGASQLARLRFLLLALVTSFPSIPFPPS